MLNFTKQFILILILAAGSTSCGTKERASEEAKEIRYDTIQVTATAYNSTEAQTKKGNIGLAAWGDTLKPGMKAIAISRDFLRENILEHNAEVKIEGLEGSYRVLDKMNKRWTRKIDIYMGLDEEAARNWGKRKVELYIPIESDTLNDSL